MKEINPEDWMEKLVYYDWNGWNGRYDDKNHQQTES